MLLTHCHINLNIIFINNIFMLVVQRFLRTCVTNTDEDVVTN